MRVLHFISGIGFGGAEQSLLHLARESRHEHRVISLSSKLGRRNDFDAAGIPVYSLRLNSFPSPFYWFKVLSIVRKWKPEVIHGWMVHGNLASFYFRKYVCPGARLVWCVRQSLAALHSYSKSIRRLVHMTARVSSSVDCVIYNSRVARSDHEAYGYSGRQTQLIYNGFDQTQLDNTVHHELSRDSLRIPKDVFLIGSYIRYHPVKGLDILLEAISLIPADVNVKLLLLGEGLETQNSTLVNDLSKRRILERVVLLGTRCDHMEILRLLDLFVLPSRSESFPNALLEAVAMGVPCVSTQVGEASEILGDAGWIVPPGESQALSSAIQAMISRGTDERLRRAAERAAEVRERYPLSKYVSSFDDLYESFR